MFPVGINEKEFNLQKTYNHSDPTQNYKDLQFAKYLWTTETTYTYLKDFTHGSTLPSPSSKMDSNVIMASINQYVTVDTHKTYHSNVE